MSDVRSDPYQFPPEKMESLTTSVSDLAVSEPQQPAPPQKDLTVIIQMTAGTGFSHMWTRKPWRRLG